jgi:hypothetical protein
MYLMDDAKLVLDASATGKASNEGTAPGNNIAA